MNAIIIYYSVTGMTLKAAKNIMDGLREKDVIVDMKSSKQITEFTNLDYDYIIIGGPVHAMNIAQPISKLLKMIKDRLIGKKVSFFITYSLFSGDQVLEKLEMKMKEKGINVIPGKAKRISHLRGIISSITGGKSSFDDFIEFGRNITIS